MDVTSVYLCVIILSVQLVRGQNLKSPCPGVFDFDKDGNDGRVLGEINLLKPVNGNIVSVLEVQISFMVDGPVLNSYNGKISPGAPNQVRKYNQGQAIKYQVLFPPTENPPKVTALIINGETICQGPEDELGKQTSRLSLRHKSKGGGLVDKPVTSSGVQSGSTGSNTDYSSTSGPVPLSLVIPANTPITTDECGLVAGGNQIVPLIHNGFSYERGDIPWLVAIYRTIANNLIFICGGTLVTDRHVVTAAHCLKRRKIVTPISEILIRVGVHRLNDWGDKYTVTRMVLDAKIHEEYNSTSYQNDILILTLDIRVMLNLFIRPACLWSGNTELLHVVGDTGVVAGWGDRGQLNIGKNWPDDPQMVRIPIVSTTKCRASKSDFHHVTYNTTFCAGDRSGVGPCTGDSGGGLYLLEDGRWRLRGVVSVSLKNQEQGVCNLNEYVVFTDTAQFLPWIRNVLSVKYYD